MLELNPQFVLLVFIDVLPITLSIWMEILDYSKYLFSPTTRWDKILISKIWTFTTVNSAAASLLITGSHDFLANYTYEGFALIVATAFLFSGAYATARRAHLTFTLRRNRIILYIALIIVIVMDAFLTP